MQTLKQVLVSALKIPKSSRSQIMILKQNCDSEAEVMYLELILFTA